MGSPTFPLQDLSPAGHVPRLRVLLTSASCLWPGGARACGPDCSEEGRSKTLGLVAPTSPTETLLLGGDRVLFLLGLAVTFGNPESKFPNRSNS